MSCPKKCLTSERVTCSGDTPEADLKLTDVRRNIVIRGNVTLFGRSYRSDIGLLGCDLCLKDTKRGLS